MMENYLRDVASLRRSRPQRQRLPGVEAVGTDARLFERFPVTVDPTGLKVAQNRVSTIF